MTRISHGGKIKPRSCTVLFDSNRGPVSRSGRFRAKTDQPRLGFANAAANKHCGRNHGEPWERERWKMERGREWAREKGRERANGRVESRGKHLRSD